MKWLSLFCLTLCTSILNGQQFRTPQNMELRNGHWFNGQTFEQKTMWVFDSVFYASSQGPVDTTIDLTAKYIIPPFGEAHNHNLESDYRLENRIRNYLDSGVFYVKHLSAIKKQLQPLMHHYNKPCGLDISTTYAPLTGSGGHPVALRERFFDWGYFDDLFPDKNSIATHGYFIIDSQQELEEKWPKILSFEPEFIKINLLYAEEYHKRKNDTSYFGQKGLNPDLVPAIVLKAHQANLRVSAHVETSYDFQVAVAAGVDEVAHLPGIDHGDLIRTEDAQLAATNGTIVVATASLIKKRAERPNYDHLLATMKENLRILKAAGVKMAIGSDNFNGNSVGEFELLHSFNIFSNLELLKMWVEESAFTTFPHKKVGKLEPGYQANFLVLKSNPLTDLAGITKQIELKVKEGLILP